MWLSLKINIISKKKIIIYSFNSYKIFFILLAKVKTFYIGSIIINIRRSDFEKLFSYYFS